MKEIRFATEQDVGLILDFISKLAEYEKMSDQVIATKELLKEWIFDKKKAEVIFALNNGKEVGFALFFNNFSTFLGRAGIYLEDIFVLPEYRGKGFGTLMLKTLAKLTIERGLGRLEWCCLDWNTPSIKFYENIGAKQLKGWSIFRLDNSALKSLADN
ncbi:MAG: GNAT family N-acetyltransferase [Clostridia bacterium]|nr:GNAT family N-acetyltransferase [Clostridia bacterium]